MNNNFVISKDVVFVGQAPSRDSNPREALSGRSGYNLAKMLRMNPLEFLKQSNRFNLNRNFTGKQGKGDKFDFNEGEITADVLWRIPTFQRFVLFGGNVWSCFGYEGERFRSAMLLKPFHDKERGYKQFLLVPHSSGINLWYNSERNRRAARKALRKFALEFVW